MSIPSQFPVPSTLIVLLGVASGLVPIPSLFTIPSRLSMKLWVVPLSNSACFLAVFAFMWRVNGTCIALLLVMYMRSVLIALAQAVGFELPKNPHAS